MAPELGHPPMPMMAANLLDSIHLLSNACAMFDDNLLKDLKPDEKRCAELIEGSLAMCTSLIPVEAFKQGKTVRELAYEVVVNTQALDGSRIAKEDIDRYLDPWSMTLPEEKAPQADRSDMTSFNCERDTAVRRSACLKR